jgi:hypothetical protein
VGFGLLAVIAVPAQGAGGPLRTDANAGTAGFATFSQPGFDMELDYAVFAPGDYPGAGVTGTDPSGGARWVYAYQAFVQSGSAGNVSDISIGLLSGANVFDEDVNAFHVAYQDTLHQTLGGDAVTSSGFSPFGDPNPTSVLMNFAGIAPGNHSVVFLLTSPNPPTFTSATATGGPAEQDTQLVPSPAPEPATLGLLGMGALALLRRRKRRCGVAGGKPGFGVRGTVSRAVKVRGQ